MANANSTGFRGERVVFSSYLHRDDAATTGDTNFLIDRGSYVDTRQGAVTRTGNLPSPSTYSIFAPSCRSMSTPSAIGLSRMRGEPSITTGSAARQAQAIMKRVGAPPSPM